jgi:ketosteroid isomerase-like protein
MADQTSVLFANEAFYAAFASSDYEAMAELWSGQATVICTHPGWTVITGRDAVLKSWRSILQNSEGSRLQCRNAEAHIYGDTALVTCYEVIDDNALAVTNVFVNEGGKWAMVHHHAGPTVGAPMPQKRSTGKRGSVH